MRGKTTEPRLRSPAPIPDPPLKESADRFNAVRAKALSVYSLLEQSLAMLFNSVLGSDSRESYVAFSDLRTYEKRRKRLANLLKQKYGDKYITFTNSMIERWSEIDTTRNNVVHWIPKTTWIFGQPVRTALHEHPNIFGSGRMTQPELEEFTNKAEFIGMLVFHFDRFLHLGDQHLAGAGRTRWSDIFQQEVLYPPADDHPIYRPPSPPLDPDPPGAKKSPARWRGSREWW